MRQIAGVKITVPVLTVAPADGADVSGTGGDINGTIPGQMKTQKFMLWLQLTGGTHADPAVWVRRTDDHVWAELMDGSTVGALPTAMLPGRYVINFENMGVFDQLALVISNNVGGVVATAQLQEVLENNYTRGD